MGDNDQSPLTDLPVSEAVGQINRRRNLLTAGGLALYTFVGVCSLLAFPVEFRPFVALGEIGLLAAGFFITRKLLK